MPKTDIGIYCETDTLKKAALFGLPSIEVLISQFYPKEISLSLDNMDILKAREETKQFIQTLKENQVTVYSVKDYLVNTSTDSNLKKSAVLKSLVNKIHHLQTKYHRQIPNWQNILEVLIEEEIAQYGPQKALGFIQNTCITPDFPLANIMYARDPMNVILQTRVTSRMTKHIRQPEIRLYEQFYQQGLGLTDNLSLPLDQNFEGGDAYVFDQVIFIGLSSRTTIDAAISIFQNLAQYTHNYEFAIVEDPDWQNRSYAQQQENMHLDTFSMPCGQKQIVVCEEEGQRRQVSLIKITNQGVEIKPTNQNYLEFLSARGCQVLAIPRLEQQSFGCNFLMLNQDTVLIPREDNLYTNKLLEKLGKNLIKVDLSECTKGYGAAHCMTGQLLRVPAIDNYSVRI